MTAGTLRTGTLAQWRTFLIWQVPLLSYDLSLQQPFASVTNDFPRIQTLGEGHVRPADYVWAAPTRPKSKSTAPHTCAFSRSLTGRQCIEITIEMTSYLGDFYL